MTLIAEDLLLLLLDDDSGSLPALWTDVDVPLAAALLAELAVDRAVRTGPPPMTDGEPLLPVGQTPLLGVQAWPSPTVYPVEGAQEADPVLAAALDTARERPRTANELALVLGDGLLDRLTARLVESGVLERHDGHVLGVIPRTTWPALETTEEASARDALRRCLVDGEEPDARTAALAALLQALDRIPRTLGLHGHEARDARDRATALGEGDWAAAVVRDAVADTATAATFGGTTPGTLLAP